jgi:RimJ/RimL family protein N-acetyltransferase
MTGRPHVELSVAREVCTSTVRVMVLGETVGVGDVVRLRPIEEAELAQLLRLVWDPTAAGEYESFGFRMDWASELERRWHEDGLIGGDSSYMAVEADRECAGWVTWRAIPRSSTFEVGIALFPEHRGHGVGTEAQRQLVAYLFDTTPVHRLQAGTEVGNIAEQKALEAAGFKREGVQRGVHFRAGQWRDSVMYGLLRDDPEDPKP